MSVYVFFCFINDIPKKRGDISMCKILKNLKKKTPDQILNIYSQGNVLPVDIVSIAKNIGISLGSADFSKLEKKDAFKKLVSERGHILGSVFIDDENVQIIYNNNLRDDEKFKHLSEVDKQEKLFRRQRFTIAHEIAHCCLHMKEDEKYHIEFRTEQTDYTTKKERDANIFAGELLIPQNILTSICFALGRRISIDFLSNIFKVSSNVMKARLRFLNEEGHLNDFEFIG